MTEKKEEKVEVNTPKTQAETMDAIMGGLKDVTEAVKTQAKSIGELKTQYDAVMADLKKEQEKHGNGGRLTAPSGRYEGTDKGFGELIPFTKFYNDAALRAGVPMPDIQESMPVHYPTKDGVRVVEKEMAAKMDNLFILSQLLGCPVNELNSFKEDSELQKAMETATSGVGGAWVPIGFSSEMVDLIRLELRVAALFGRFNQPTDDYRLPQLLSGMTAEIATELQGPTVDSDPGTGKKIFSATKLMVRGGASYEAEEELLIPVLPLLRREIVYALAVAQETATINGDLTATHQDSDVTNPKDARKAWYGLRFRGLSASYANCNYDVQTGTTEFTYTDIRKARKAMGKFGLFPGDLALISGLASYFAMLDFEQILTVDKYGQGATILSGELGKIDGIPIIISEHVREDVNASGVYDGVTTNLSTLLLVRKAAGSWLYGDRRAVMVETDRDIINQKDIIVASEKLTFDTPRLNTEKQVCTMYNVKT
jgi:HK97 family phage major capsid protein